MSKLTVNEAWQVYITARTERREIGKESGRIFREALRPFAEFVGKDRPLSSITREDCDKWVRSMNRLAIRTIRLRIGTVRRFFRWAATEGHIREDPMLGIGQPKLPRYIPRGLSDTQVAEALANAVDNREKLILLLMVGEGLRSMEVAGLEWADIDLREKKLVVRGKGGHERVLATRG